MDTRPNFVCVDTRPKLCVWIRVPSCVYGYASRIVCMDTRPNFVHGYASQINVPIRVPNELFIKVRNSCTRACTHNVHVYTRPKWGVWIRGPMGVYGYASHVVCMDTRHKLSVWIRVPTLCMDTRPTCEFVCFLCEFSGFLGF